jgi:hypothetical protein
LTRDCCWFVDAQWEEMLKLTRNEASEVEEELKSTNEFVKIMQKQVDKLKLQLDTQYV